MIIFTTKPKPRKSLFMVGQVVATPGALEALSDAEQPPAMFLDRHVIGDWGDCCDEDAQLNDQALDDGSRIFSVYHTRNEVKLWVITEAKDDDGSRQSTCILLPEEY